MSAGEVRVHLVADTSRFEAAMRKAMTATRDLGLRLERFRRHSRTMAALLEILPLTEAEAWGRFYARGALDPTYASEKAVDEYLRVLTGVHLPAAAAARDAFLRGWVEHQAAPGARAVVWHRFIGDTAIQVHPEVTE